MASLVKSVVSSFVKSSLPSSSRVMYNSARSNSFFGHFMSESYASAYPSVRAITSEYMSVMPYAIDGNGKPVDHPILDAYFHPNKEDSVVAFSEKIATSTLVKPKTYILVWRRKGRKVYPGGDFTKDNIGGFTFLECPIVTRQQGTTHYKVGQDSFNENEVLVLPGGVDPHNLSRGYSPSEAARRWITLDDYIADYQAGFFENGAVPAGQFVITAATTEEYDDVVNMIERKHRGAGKNGNVTFAHNPIDPSTNRPAGAQIEWIPFAQTNKDIDFGVIFEQANKRIDLAYGVPQIVKGVDDAATYANAQVADAGFAKRAVYPLLLRNYTQINHELNRITNGTGIALTFDYEIPAVADEEKVVAETKEVESGIIVTMVKEGYTLDSVIDAFKLSNSYKLLKKGVSSEAVIDNDKPEVDEGGEVSGAPDPNDVGAYRRSAVKQVSSRDYPDLYDGTGVDPSNLGCIMADTEMLDVMEVMGMDSVPDLYVKEGSIGLDSVEAEVAPHVTLLYGLLENGNKWKDKVDAVLDGWSLEKVKIKEVSYFDLPDKYAIIAHIEETSDLIDGHERLTLLPHINTFSTYRPHMTLAYINKDADLGKWLTSLNEAYAGKELKITGINYGDPEDKSDTKTAGGSESKNPKANTHAHTDVKNLEQSQVDDLELQLSTVIGAAMDAQIERAIASISTKSLDYPEDIGEPTEEENNNLALAILTLLIPAMALSGAIEKNRAKQSLADAGIPINLSDILTYSPSDATRADYNEYLNGVALSFNSGTSASIKKVLEQAVQSGIALNETVDALRNIRAADQYRVRRLSTTEAHRSQQTANLSAMKEMEEEYDVKLQKMWVAGGSNPCPYCIAMNGTVKELDATFVDFGDYITADDGSIMVNDFQDMNEPPVHPSCHCYMTYSVI